MGLFRHVTAAVTRLNSKLDSKLDSMKFETHFPDSVTKFELLFHQCLALIGLAMIDDDPHHTTIAFAYTRPAQRYDVVSPEASISTRILCLDPTTFEAYRVHLISGPDQVFGRCWGHWRTFVNIYLTSPRRKIVTTTPAAISRPKIYANALAAGHVPRIPALPRHPGWILGVKP